MPIPWSNDLSVNVKEIDAQHQIFLGILNSLYELIEKPETEAELADILKQLEGYTSYHFATEEKYFDKFDYELSEEHKEEHQELWKQVLKFKARYHAGEEEILAELVGFLEGWLMEHLSTQDKKYTQCFNSHGLF